jgi:acetyl esterase
MRERKPIDGALRRFLDEEAAPSGDPQMTDEALVRFGRAFLLRALENRASIPGLPNDVETLEVEIAPGLAARLYMPPRASVPLPVLVYLHGGGWVVGSVATHDPFCRLLSEAAGVIVASVEYRLAPEHPYPAAVEDTLAAVHWAADNAAEWGGNPSRLALGGDSAGANLAAVAANRVCVTAETHALHALLLLYPVIAHPSAAHPPTQRMRPATDSRRTSCAGSGSSMRQAFRRTIRMRHRCNHRRCLRFRRRWLQRRSTTFCATRVSPLQRSSKRRALR